MIVFKEGMPVRGRLWIVWGGGPRMGDGAADEGDGGVHGAKGGVGGEGLRGALGEAVEAEGQARAKIQTRKAAANGCVTCSSTRGLSKMRMRNRS